MLRGVAIALVLLRHAWPDVFGSAGIVGVVVFFALSGYLITGILLKDINSSGRVRYGSFYRNRAIRLLPALLLFLAVFAVLTIVWDPLGQRETVWQAVVIGVTYTANLPIPQGSSAIGHLWTLATEEQFYLIWPLILTFAIRRGRALQAILIASAVILVLLAASLYVSRDDVGRIYGLPTSWALAMVIGSAARIWKTRIATSLPRSASRRGALGGVAMGALLALSFIPDGKESPLSYFLLGPAVALLALVLVFVWSDWAEPPTRLLLPLLHLGTISYALYLWNYPIAVWLHASYSDWWVPAATIAFSIAAATVSWFAVEKPAQRLRLYLDERRREDVERPVALTEVGEGRSM